MKLPTFAHPSLLLWGILAALLLLLLFRSLDRTRARRLRRFASPRMIGLLTASLSPGRRRIKAVLLALAVFACFAALAGPRFGTEWIEVQQRGIDILIGLDASRSMLATDMEPNRLTRAKLAIRDFVSRLTGDRVGLLPFAGTTFLMCPLTTDYEAFLRSLDAVEPDLLPRQGTDLAAVIDQARQILTRENNHRILLLITDGEDLRGNALEAAKAAARDKVTIFTVGVGTSQGELIPDPERPGAFLKDEQGKFVRSRLDEKSLQAIATITGGIYVPLGRMGEGLMRIYQEKLKRIPEQEFREHKEKRPIERFYWPLAAALVLFIVEFLLGERRKKGATEKAFLSRLTETGPGSKFTTLLVCLFLAWHPVQAQALTTEELYHQGQLDEALKRYRQALAKDPDNPVLHYNLGDVLYRQKQYGGAAAEFAKGLTSDDLDLQARSYFNLGNSHFQMGAAAGRELAKAEEAYKKAVNAYEASLKLQPGDADAKANLELARKRLQEIQKQKQQQQNQQDKQDKKQKEEQRKKNNDKKQGAQNQPSSGKKKDQQQKNGQQPGQDKDKTKGQQNKQTKRSSPQRQDAGKNTSDQSGAGQDREKASKPDQQDTTRPQQGDQAGQQQNPQPKPQDSDTARQHNSQAGQAGMGQQQQQARLQRARAGTMTQEEAKALLEALRDQEGLPVYVPADGASTDEQNSKNW